MTFTNSWMERGETVTDNDERLKKAREAVRDAFRWVGDVLSEARDREYTKEYMDDLMDAQNALYKARNLI